MYDDPKGPATVVGVGVITGDSGGEGVGDLVAPSEVTDGVSDSDGSSPGIRD